jgi:hypothetical protein
MNAKETTINKDTTTDNTGIALIHATKEANIPGLEITASCGIIQSAGMRMAMAINTTNNRVNKPWSLSRLII